MEDEWRSARPRKFSFIGYILKETYVQFVWPKKTTSIVYKQFGEILDIVIIIDEGQG